MRGWNENKITNNCRCKYWITRANGCLDVLYTPYHLLIV
jgi:hypothetical protein